MTAAGGRGGTDPSKRHMQNHTVLDRDSGTVSHRTVS
jgi:hypothetical protein